MRLHFLIGETDRFNEAVVAQCESMARMALAQNDKVAFHRQLFEGYLLLGNLFMAYNQLREELIALRNESPSGVFNDTQQARWNFCSHRQATILALQGPRPVKPSVPCVRCGSHDMKTKMAQNEKGVTQLYKRWCTKCTLIDVSYCNTNTGERQ